MTINYLALSQTDVLGRIQSITLPLDSKKKKSIYITHQLVLNVCILYNILHMKVF